MLLASVLTLSAFAQTTTIPLYSTAFEPANSPALSTFDAFIEHALPMDTLVDSVTLEHTTSANPNAEPVRDVLCDEVTAGNEVWVTWHYDYNLETFNTAGPLEAQVGGRVVYERESAVWKIPFSGDEHWLAPHEVNVAWTEIEGQEGWEFEITDDICQARLAGEATVDGTVVTEADRLLTQVSGFTTGSGPQAHAYITLWASPTVGTTVGAAAHIEVR